MKRKIFQLFMGFLVMNSSYAQTALEKKNSKLAVTCNRSDPNKTYADCAKEFLDKIVAKEKAIALNIKKALNVCSNDFGGFDYKTAEIKFLASQHDFDGYVGNICKARFHVSGPGAEAPLSEIQCTLSLHQENLEILNDMDRQLSENNKYFEATSAQKSSKDPSATCISK
jgi:hypothetical protein